MYSRKRITALLLSALMLSQVLASCGSDGSSTDTTLPVTTVPEETGYEIYHDLEGLDYEGKEFNLWIANSDDGLYMEEETGDIYDDTVYARNRSVEEQLNVKFNVLEQKYGSSGTAQGEASTAMQALILAGDDTYHAFHHVQHSSMPSFIASGYFADWNDIPNVDLTKPYWYQGLINGINYGTKIYALTGSYSIAVMSSANCLFFNKDILDKAQIEYPYQLVLDGKWTFDKWTKMIEDTTQDLNGDTVIDPKVDQYGYWGWGWEQTYGLFVGMGGDIVEKDENNLPVNKILSERNVDIVDKINAMFQLPGAAMEWSDSGIFRTTFINGTLTFLHGSLSWATQFRDMENDFGFIPYPKYDEKQENYNVRIQNTANLTYIPLTNQELDFTGAVLEVLAAESYNTVIPTYFDTVLTVKTTRDTESEQMVPFILDCATFWDSAVTQFAVPTLLRPTTTSLATYYAGVESAVNEQLNELIKTYTGEAE